MRNMKEFKAHQCPGGRHGGWARVRELRAAGQLDEAAEAARKVMGVEGPKMTEEQKAKLREYSKTPEAKERARVRRAHKQIQVKVATRTVALQEERKASYARRAEKRTAPAIKPARSAVKRKR